MKTPPKDLLVLLEEAESPTLLMQPEPRLVVTANNKACELFDKNLDQIEGRRGGQVFDCIHSFTEKGCGLDPNCEDCKVKAAIVDTFLSGKTRAGIQTTLEVKKNNVIASYIIEVSILKRGGFSFVTIEKYKKMTNPH